MLLVAIWCEGGLTIRRSANRVALSSASTLDCSLVGRPAPLALDLGKSAAAVSFGSRLDVACTSFAGPARSLPAGVLLGTS